MRYGVNFCSAVILAFYHFFLVELPCDQIWWDSPIFSIVGCLLYIVHAKNTLVGAILKYSQKQMTGKDHSIQFWLDSWLVGSSLQIAAIFHTHSGSAAHNVAFLIRSHNLVAGSHRSYIVIVPTFNVPISDNAPQDWKWDRITFLDLHW